MVRINWAPRLSAKSIETAPDGFVTIASAPSSRASRACGEPGPPPRENDDFRAGFELGVTQKLKAVHLQHLDIQQDQRKVRMLGQLFQRVLSVAGGGDNLKFWKV